MSQKKELLRLSPLSFQEAVTGLLKVKPPPKPKKLKKKGSAKERKA